MLEAAVVRAGTPLLSYCLMRDLKLLLFIGPLLLFIRPKVHPPKGSVAVRQPGETVKGFRFHAARDLF